MAITLAGQMNTNQLNLHTRPNFPDPYNSLPILPNTLSTKNQALLRLLLVHPFKRAIYQSRDHKPTSKELGIYNCERETPPKQRSVVCCGEVSPLLNGPGPCFKSQRSLNGPAQFLAAQTVNSTNILDKVYFCVSYFVDNQFYIDLVSYAAHRCIIFSNFVCLLSIFVQKICVKKIPRNEV
jgi:hypothetical protein